MSVSFDNTEVAFASKSDSELLRAYFLFKAIGIPSLVRIGPSFVNFAMMLRLPVKKLIKSTIFAHFCGGESIKECKDKIHQLFHYKIGTILDYSVEGKEREEDFNNCVNETIATIQRAKGDPAVPFCVFKVTGLARFGLLEKLDRLEALNLEETKEFEKVRERVDSICKNAFEAGVPVFIDAEESWIQDTVDLLAEEMMERYNREGLIVYNTIQMYRSDRLGFLEESISKARSKGYKLGIKLVRGAYMEKERERALRLAYPSPIQPDKEATDRDYNKGLGLCIGNIDIVGICAGTHNEASSQLLVKLMEKHNISPADKRLYFSQLLGMSDHISFNLAASGYNVAKYVPYGPVASVLPYLFRRANENTSIAGQTSRELGLIIKERQRRKQAKARR